MFDFIQNSKSRTENACLFGSCLFMLFCTLTATPADADLIDKGKSDSAIKMLVFPQSLRVIENRARQISERDAIPPDPGQIRKTLLKVDPARIAPAKAGEAFTRPVTRDRLRELGQQYSEDVIFIFRRNLKTEVIRYEGLLYLAKQKKVLALKGNENADPFIGLKTLAQEARKLLHSHKFEKRQSAY